MKDNAFTLIELLLVVSIIGILSGVALMVINPRQLENQADDGVRVSHIEKVVQALEAYNAAEGSYPTSSNNQPVAPDYITNWPDTGGTLGDEYANYVYYIESGSMCVSVPMATNPSEYIKYVNPGSHYCYGRVLWRCGENCGDGFDPRDCEVVSGGTCW